MKCRHCGANNPRKSQSCTACGLPLFSKRQYRRHAVNASGSLCRVCGVSLPGAVLCPNCAIPFGMVLDIRDSTLSTLINANTANQQVQRPLQTDGFVLPDGIAKRWNWGAFVLTSVWTAVHQLWWYWFYCTALAVVALTAVTVATANPHWSPGHLVMIGTITVVAIVWLYLKSELSRRAASLAWRTGKYRSVEAYNRSYRSWNSAAAIYTLLALAISVVVITLNYR